MNKLSLILSSLATLPQKWHITRFLFFLILGVVIYFIFSEHYGSTIIILAIIQIISVYLVNFFKALSSIIFGSFK